ncbi:hypothetical protein MPSEU_000123100 [Mayamaea pseudoterrestris]|nr:hypothetical protein MPSEU_000123100 [Mayamaea pseudoterrestris]
MEMSSRGEYSCPNGLVYIEDIIQPASDETNVRFKVKQPSAAAPSHTADIKTIPRMIHQTSKSRCVTPEFARAIHQWQVFATRHNYSYYMHDDEAVLKLLLHDVTATEFSTLRQIVQHCILHGTMRSDLWRYVVLYYYGGIYADLDAAPTERFHSDLMRNASGVFVVEQYHLLSQYFMAVAPQHPLMWYAIQVSLHALMGAFDVGSAPAAMTTGPHALHKALMAFCNDHPNAPAISAAGAGRKPVKAGVYFGTRNYSVAVYGVAERQNEIVNRDVLGGIAKRQDYLKMKMRHFTEDKRYATGQSCLSAMYAAQMKQ